MRVLTELQIELLCQANSCVPVEWLEKDLGNIVQDQMDELEEWGLVQKIVGHPDKHAYNVTKRGYDHIIKLMNVPLPDMKDSNDE